MQINEVLKQSKLPLVEKEILLADLLKKDRSFLHSNSEFELSSDQESEFLQRLARREKHEPVAYILGYQEFWGRKFLVNKDVLIPRADTEILVQDFLHYSEGKKFTVVDVGTGAGCIAITLKLENPNLKVIATEISKEALEVAEKNSKLHNAEIELVHCSLLDEVKEKVDIVVANLPYIPTKNWEKLPEEIRDFEPRVSLESWDSKTTIYEVLFKQAKEKLNKGGIIFYEVDGEVFTHKP